MKTIKLLTLSTFLFIPPTFGVVLPGTAVAHEGKLDSMGCHYSRNNRDYHCHDGKLEGMTFRSRAEAIRNYNRLKKRHKKNDDDDDGEIF